MATIQNNSMYGVSIQFKYKASTDWTGSEVLLAGEIGLEIDTGKYKLGDGTTTWTNLEYYSNPTTDAVVTALATRVSTNEGAITQINAKDAEQDAEIAAIKGITVISANPAPSQNAGA